MFLIRLQNHGRKKRQSKQAALQEIGKLLVLEIFRREGLARASCYVMR